MELNEETVLTFVAGLGNGEQSAIALFGMKSRALGQLLDKATALIEMKKFDQAEALLIDLSDLAPTAASVVWLLGDCRVKRGDLAGALRAFSEAVDRSKKLDDRELIQLSHIARAKVLLALNEPHLAQSDLQAASTGSDDRLADFARHALALSSEEVLKP